MRAMNFASLQRNLLIIVVRLSRQVTSQVPIYFIVLWGSAPANNIAQVTEATDSSPATVTSEGTIDSDLAFADGNHVTRSIKAVDSARNTSEGTAFRLKTRSFSEKKITPSIQNVCLRLMIRIISVKQIRITSNKQFKTAHDVERDRIQDITFEGGSSENHL